MTVLKPRSATLRNKSWGFLSVWLGVFGLEWDRAGEMKYIV